MKILLTIVALAMLVSTNVSAEKVEHEMFNQLVVLLDIDADDQQKLAVAFVTLEENLYAATAGVGDENIDPQQIIDDFNATRSAFRDTCGTFLSKEQFDTMMKYSSAIFYELADDIARVQVKHFEDSLELTGEQMTALTLVVNEDLRSVVETLLVYGEGADDGSAPEVMSEELRDVRENTRAQIKKILSEEQWTKLQKMLAEMKG